MTTKEIKVYVVRYKTRNKKLITTLNDLNSFMYVSEKQGNVYSLSRISKRI